MVTNEDLQSVYLFKCIVLILLVAMSIPITQAQQYSFNDRNPGHTLSNQTVSGIAVQYTGTVADIDNIIVDGGRVLASSGGTLHITNSTINTTSTYTPGLQAQGVTSSALGEMTRITGNGLSISSVGWGISVSGSSLVDLYDVNIAAGLNGLELNGSLSNKNGDIGTTKIENFEITAKKYGVYAMFGSEVHLTDGIIKTHDNNSHGIYLGGANNEYQTPIQTMAYMKEVTVYTQGDSAYGLYSLQMGGTNGMPNRGAVSYWNDSHLITEGNSSHGVVANYSWNAVELTSGSTVTTSGDYAYGIWSLGAANVTLDDSHVQTQGMNAVGIYSYYLGNSYLRNGSTVITSGEEAHGAMVQYAGQITLANSTIHAQGMEAHGIYMLAGLAENAGIQYGSKVELQSSNIISDKGYGIATVGGHLTVNVLDGSTLEGGIGLMDVQNYAGTGTPTWDQGVTQVNLMVDGNSLVSGHVQTAGTAVSNITLQNNSTWVINGDSNITTLMNRNSTILFLPNTTQTTGHDFNTLRVNGDYVGDGGSIIFNAALGGDDSPSDKLIVGGDVFGQTYVEVINRGGVGSSTEEGIQIIEVSGLSPSNAFQLRSDYTTSNGEAAVVVGAYSYSLYQGSVSDPNNGSWYLRSKNGGTPQPGVPLYESYTNVLHELNTLPTLRERMGECDFDADMTEKEGNDHQSRSCDDVWYRVYGTSKHFEPKYSTTNVEYDIDAWHMQAGINKTIHERDQGSLVAGVTIHYGDARSKISSVFGSGKIDTKGYGVGGTLTWYGNNNMYVDIQTQISWFDSDIQSSNLNIEEVNGNNGFGYALGVEIGRKFTVQGNWVLTPQAQITYSNVDYDSFFDVYSAPVNQLNKERVVGRLGLALNYNEITKNNVFDTYGIINIYQNFNRTSRVKVADKDFKQDSERTWIGIGLGGSYSWRNKEVYHLYYQAGVKTSISNFSDNYSISGTVGLRINF